jgi:hypothetical protein
MEKDRKGPPSLRRRRNQISGSVRTAIATLSHNRSFNARDLAEYRGYSMPEATGIIRSLKSKEMLRKVEDGGWYPTSMGWDWIEGRQFAPSDYDKHGMRK